MKPEIYWIDGTEPGRLAILARPRGGDWLADEVRGWREAGVDVVVSALTVEEETEWELNEEAGLCRKHGLEFVSFPITDRGVPSSEREASELAIQLAGAWNQGRSVGIHCRAGIGRSTLIAASVLLTLGVDFDGAWHRIGAARGRPVPDTPEQKEWVRRFTSDATVARSA